MTGGEATIAPWMLAPENLDRKRVRFAADSCYRAHGAQLYLAPELFIVKTHPGRLLFNAFVRTLGPKEARAHPIRGDPPYPVYVLSCSWINAGHHFGLWEQFPDIVALQREVALRGLVDDFTAMAEEIRAALSLPLAIRRIASAG